MTSKKLQVVTLGALLFCSACSKEEREPEIQPLPKIENVSLNYHSSAQTLTLPRNIEAEGSEISIKDNSYWITKLRLEGNILSFEILENTEIERGHRFDTILIANKGKRIGSICVTQARNPISMTRLAWANADATYKNTPISDGKLSGLEMTKLIYELSKSTNGKDSYKNYPAFAFCIEMNHDPERNIEWYLPSLSELQNCASGQSYAGTPLYQHNYWWSSTENALNGNAFSLYSKSYASRGAESKSGKWWVMAFKNGKMGDI